MQSQLKNLCSHICSLIFQIPFQKSCIFLIKILWNNYTRGANWKIKKTVSKAIKVLLGANTDIVAKWLFKNQSLSFSSNIISHLARPRSQSHRHIFFKSTPHTVHTYTRCSREKCFLHAKTIALYFFTWIVTTDITSKVNTHHSLFMKREFMTEDNILILYIKRFL